MKTVAIADSLFARAQRVALPVLSKLLVRSKVTGGMRCETPWA